MFLKNSIIFLTSLFWIFSLNFSSKIEIVIPKLNYQDNISNLSQIEIKDNLEDLKITDKIIIKKETEILYYKVINKYYLKDNEDINYTVDNDDTIMLKSVNKQENLKTIIIAINIGKMMTDY